MTLFVDGLVLKTANMHQAISAIEASDAKIALVVDEQKRLLGTITDGDVRRGLLRGLSMDALATEIMSPHPIVARQDEERSQVLARMRNHSLRHMPILDEQGHVLRIETLHSLLASPKKNWVFLMAGGFGKRLRPLTETIPKPMLPVGGKPVLETILERFIEAGFRHFCISLHYLGDSVRQHFGDGSTWGVEIIYVQESTPLGTAGALSLLPEPPVDPIVMMNGDILTSVNFTTLLDFHHEHQAAATMCLRQYDFQVPYGTVDVQGPWAERIVEKPTFNVFVNAGIYVLSPEAVAQVPPGQPKDMPDLLSELMAQRPQAVAVYPIHEYWIDIGRMEDFERAQIDIKNL